MTADIAAVIGFLISLYVAHWAGRKRGQAEAKVHEEMCDTFFEGGYSIALNIEGRYEVTDGAGAFVLSHVSFTDAVVMTLVGARGRL
jgi:hypothetical protein